MNRSPEKSNRSGKKINLIKRIKKTDRKKLLSQVAVVGLIVLVGVGALAGMGLLPHKDKKTGKKYGWFGAELAKNATSLWNPFASPPTTPNPTLQLSKEYIYAGDRLLAIEEAGVGGRRSYPDTNSNTQFRRRRTN